MLPQLGTIPVLPLYMIYCNSGYVTTRSNVNKGICFIRKFDTLERQTMGVNKYASTFPVASCVSSQKKTWRKKYENTQLFLQVRN